MFLSSACTESRLSLFPTLPGGGQGVGRGSAGTANLNWPVEPPIQHINNIRLSSKTSGRGKRKLWCWFPRWLLFGGWLDRRLPLVGGEWLALFICLFICHPDFFTCWTAFILTHNFSHFALPIFYHLSSKKGQGDERAAVWILGCWLGSIHHSCFMWLTCRLSSILCCE